MISRRVLGGALVFSAKMAAAVSWYLLPMRNTCRTTIVHLCLRLSAGQVVMSLAMKPFRLSLERAELWLIPRPECESHPLVIALYVPREHADPIMRSVRLPAVR